ncbi:MAG TPA: hypothetical protein VK053_19450, partial [Jiangellaceae bacterium]|nr:hypothetical protein [Jiangellaceae bacterium]
MRSAHHSATTDTTTETRTEPPVAKRLPTTRERHGDSVRDEYAWLIDPDDPDTLAYLEAENAYTAAATAHTASLRQQIYDEIDSRTLQTDLSVPFRRDGWWYYSRTEQGQQYGRHCRSATEPQIPTDPT